MALFPGRPFSFWIALSGFALALIVGCHPGDPVVPSGPAVVVKFQDPACDQKCDAYGSCTFPKGACGHQSCDGGTDQLSAQICDGLGLCAAYAPFPCAGHLICADAESCLASCTLPSDCAAGFTCKSGDCVPPN